MKKNSSTSRQRFLRRRYHHLKRRLIRLLQRSHYAIEKVSRLLERLRRYARQLALPALTTATLLGFHPAEALSQHGKMGPEFRVAGTVGGVQQNPEMVIDGLGNTIVVYESGDFVGTGIFMKRYDENGQTITSQTRVNTEIIGDQSNPAVASNADGDFVVVWHEVYGAYEDINIYGQRFDSDGNKEGNQFQVNNPGYYSVFPDVAMDANGNFTVTWHKIEDAASNTYVYAQRFNANGTKEGPEFQINGTTFHQYNPAIAMSANGDFIIVWDGPGNGENSEGIFGQRFDAAGNPTGAELHINDETAGSQKFPDIALASSGNFVVVWEDANDGSEQGVNAGKFDANGNELVNEFRVNDWTTGAQNAPKVVMAADDSFAVSWQSFGQDGDGYGIYGQRFDELGGFKGDEFQVNSYTTSAQKNPAIAMDNRGDIIIAWQSNEQLGLDIYAQRYLFGTGDEFRVNTVIDNLQASPSIGIDSDGDFVVAWYSRNQNSSFDHIYAQRFNAQGSKLGSEFRVSSTKTFDQRFPKIAMNNEGNFVIIWESESQNQNSSEIYGRRYTADGGVIGSEFQINTSFIPDFSPPRTDIAMDEEDGFVVIWHEAQFSGGEGPIEIYGQRYDANNNTIGAEFQLNSNFGDSQRRPAIEMDDNGNFVIVWESLQNNFPKDIYGQRYTPNGSKIGNEFLVNTEKNPTLCPSVGMDSDGNFVVVWTSRDQDGSGYGIYGRRYAANGIPLGGEFQINTETQFYQQFPAVGMDAKGDFVVVWASYSQDSSSDDHGVYGQRYAANGSPIGGEFQINTETQFEQTQPSIGIDVDGDFVVVWQSYLQDGSHYGIYGQRYANKFPLCSTIPIELSGLEFSNAVHQTASTITSSQIIENGADVHYQAGESILLNENFEVRAGAVFLAEIQACETVNDFVPPSTSTFARTETITDQAQEIPIASKTLQLFPNPTQNSITFVIPEEEQVEAVWLCNHLGQVVQEGDIKDREMGLAHLQRGMYFLVVQTEGKRYVEAVVRE